MKIWDAFISHASENKDDVVIPLAELLLAKGLKVWVDKQEIRIGDSLRAKIDEGLAKSRFGIVILSPEFMAKHWTIQEFNGLSALEDRGHKVILPVRHNLNTEQLRQHSPIMADRFAAHNLARPSAGTKRDWQKNGGQKNQRPACVDNHFSAPHFLPSFLNLKICAARANPDGLQCG